MNSRSMKTRWMPLLVALACAGFLLGIPSESQAQSATHGNFELRLGPYYPSIDEEAALQGERPFEGIFGTGERLMFEVQFDYYLFEAFGKLGIGLSVGYTNFTGDAEIESSGDGDNSTPNSTANSGTNNGTGEDGGDSGGVDVSEETNFNVIPFRLSALYRLDWFAQEFGIPLVPRARGGVDYWLWEIEDGSGNTASFNGNDASGGKLGWHAAIGLEFLLDFFSEEAAATFDINWGVNNTYLFGEYRINRINDFGGEGLDLSDETWMFGLAFEF